MTDRQKMPERFAQQQFHNSHMFDDSEYSPPEWYEMPNAAEHFASGGEVVQKALSVARHLASKGAK